MPGPPSGKAVKGGGPPGGGGLPGGEGGVPRATDRGTQEYIINILNPITEDMITDCLIHRPNPPGLFMIKWLCERLNIDVPQQVTDGIAQQPSPPPSATAQQGTRFADIPEEEADPSSSSDSSDSDDDDEDEENDKATSLRAPPAPPRNFNRGARQSVSAEAYGAWNPQPDASAFVAPSYPKTEEQSKRIRVVLEDSFLFRALDPANLETIILAMQESVHQPSEEIIKQGDDGECLFVIDSGVVECYKKFSGDDDAKLVKTCTVSDTFGELALLYNTPRAASVIAKEKSILWKLDRETFNAIVKTAATKKREMYEQFLSKVPLLESIDNYERSKIADALKSEVYTTASRIVKQGEQGDKFYIVEEGNAVAVKTIEEGQEGQEGQGEEKELMEYASGDYFGELALLRNAPRAASVVAKTDCKVASLDRRSFRRLLGPLQDIITRNAATRYA